MILDDHLRTLGGPAGGWSVPAVTAQAQELTVAPASPTGEELSAAKAWNEEEVDPSDDE